LVARTTLRDRLLECGDSSAFFWALLIGPLGTVT
jgi:hypothetical protein